VVKMDSGQARKEWRNLLDQTYAKGGEVVIERYSKPIAVLVNYEQWQVLKRQRLELLDRLSAEAKAGDYVPFEEVEAEMKARGIIA